MNEIRTGRALQLEGLQYATNKVTLGFKCEARTKIELAQEAQQMGMTLSEYVDTIISTRKQHTKSNNNFELQTLLSQQKTDLHHFKGKSIFMKMSYCKTHFNCVKVRLSNTEISMERP
jgi:macrodomain Ter protein organizer (MatP/YcbG family)